MYVRLNVNGISQYGTHILEKYRNSACGPVTTHVILNYLCQDSSGQVLDVNTLYKQLGGTKIGLFKWRFIKNLRKLLGEGWTVENCSITAAIEQLQHGHPVAMRFDIYFNRQFLKHPKPLFKYHWVPLIGYEIKDGELYLIIHDNGGRNRESRIRTFRYEEQRPFLSFVKIEQNNTY